MHLHQADCCILVDSTLIKHSSAFVVSSVCKIERCKVGRESPRIADQEEHTPNFWRLKYDGSLGNNDHSVGVVKVVMVKTAEEDRGHTKKYHN